MPVVLSKICDTFIKNFMASLEFFSRRPSRYLAVDFNPSLIGIVHVLAKGDRYELLHYESKRITSPQEGTPDAAVDFISGFLKKNSIEDKSLILGISGTDGVFIRYLTLPALPEEEIGDAIRWQVKEDAPFPLDDAARDWQVIKSSTGDDGAQQNGIIFIAIRKEVLQKYASIVERCGLQSVQVTSSPFGYAHFLHHHPEKIKEAAVLDIGYKNSTLNIYFDGKLNFVRRLPISWEKLTQSLMEILVSAQGTLKLSYEEAESIRREIGIPENVGQVVKGNIQTSQILALMRPHLEALVRELKFSFNYFTAQNESEAPAHLYLTGAGVDLKNLDTYLNKELGFKVSYLPLPASLHGQGIDAEHFARGEQRHVMNALGAAFGDSSSINLLPADVRIRRETRIPKAFLRLAGITTAAIFAVLIFLLQFRSRDYQNRLKGVQQHFQVVREIKDLHDKTHRYENLLTQVERGRVVVDAPLKVVSRLIPPEAVLESLQLDQAQHTLILKGTLSGADAGVESVLIDFMERLERSVLFREATLLSSQKAGTAQQFEIKCDLAIE